MTADRQTTRMAAAELAGRTREISQAFGTIEVGAMPTALAVALAHLSKVASDMNGVDDISLQVDLVAGTLHFRAYRRPQLAPQP
jgi:hypothetical protein